jgi:outer membrane lipoprotein-sorting protein
MSRREAGSVATWPLAILMLLLPATSLSVSAQESGTTIVPKTPSATGGILPQAAPTGTGTVPPAVMEQPQEIGQPDVYDQLRPAQGALDEGAVPPSEVVDPTQTGWGADVQAAIKPGQMQADQSSLVQKVNTFFNSITNLQGTFEQVDSNNKQTTGRFYVQRPGRIRFDYAPPSPLRIIADGHSLAIEDSDLRTVEKYPLKSTPFRLLLVDEVDLDRDARIVSVDQSSGELSITIEDKSGEAPGQIRLYFKDGSELQLKQWVITDGQGLDTRVADFFKSKESFPAFR